MPPPASFTCDFCEARFKHKWSLSRQRKSAHLRRSFRCKQCTLTYSRQNSFLIHIRRDHPGLITHGQGDPRTPVVSAQHWTIHSPTTQAPTSGFPPIERHATDTNASTTTTPDATIMPPSVTFNTPVVSDSPQHPPYSTTLVPSSSTTVENTVVDLASSSLLMDDTGYFAENNTAFLLTPKWVLTTPTTTMPILTSVDPPSRKMHSGPHQDTTVPSGTHPPHSPSHPVPPTAETIPCCSTTEHNWLDDLSLQALITWAAPCQLPRGPASPTSITAHIHTRFPTSSSTPAACVSYASSGS